MKPRGWWRRNMWGLILVVPLVAGLFAMNLDEIYRRNFSALPNRAVPVDGTGKATLDDVQVRLVELAAVDNPDDIKKLVGSGAPLPATVKVWHAIVSFGAPEGANVSGCTTVELIDSKSRPYRAGPSQLPGAPGSLTGCTKDDSKQSSPYLTTFNFLLPADARPASLRITWGLRLPRYVLLPVSAG